MSPAVAQPSGGPARLVYVIGPSGSGKDSLLAYARGRLAETHGVVFAHRYITRPADAGGENHVALSRPEFAVRLREHLFALAWESHGTAYGVGIEINQWLAKGATVVVNGSREYLPEAQRRFPDLLPVWIDVSVPTLQSRLQARGREDTAAIASRLQRHEALRAAPRAGPVIDNNGPLCGGGDELVSLILRQRVPAALA